jgi:hypothetical protein
MLNGRSLEKRLRTDVLNESSSSDFINVATSYNFIFDAVLEYNRKTFTLTGQQIITTVAGQRTYNLNPDFLSLFMTDDELRYFVTWYNGSAYTNIFFREYGATVYEQNIYSNPSTTALIAETFSLIDATPPSAISGTATATKALSNGTCILEDSTAPFSSVTAGDKITNITDNSDGYVLSVTDGSHLVTAILGGANTWTSSDDYMITPAQRYAIYFDPIPSTDGHTVTVNYLKKPTPVYSDFGTYPLDGNVE